MRRLEVRLNWGTDGVKVGTLAEHEGRIYFEFDSDFLADPLPVSPLHLPTRSGLHEDPLRTFGGLHGVFNDSLPDGWGRLLMDRHLRRRGIALSKVTPLDRLAYIHDRGMGALTYHPPSDRPLEDGDELDLTTLAQQAERIVEGSPENALPALELAGASPGGARPKILVGVNPTYDHLIAGTSDLPPDYRHFVIKFATLEDGPDIGPIEAAYAQMARGAGVTMPQTRLFETSDGRRHFGVERFDRRVDNGRLHTHTLGGLLQASHRLPSVSYEGFLKATLSLTKDQRQLQQAFRRAVFNVIAHNRDDHVKNFSYLMLSDGTWRLAPAYDLVYSTGINGWHTMDVAGEARSPGRADLLRLAGTSGITSAAASDTIDEVVEAVNAWPHHASAFGVPDEIVAGISRDILVG